MSRIRALLSIVALLLGAIPVFSQISNGTVKGTVVDASGSPVPSAKVELRNTGTGAARQQTTSDAGSYDFSDVPAGQYALQAAAQGFAEWTGNLTLSLTQTAVVDITLSPASVQTVVEVTDVTPVISPQISSLSDVKEWTRINSLPLQSRNFLSILNLTPGVVANNFANQGNAYTRVNGLRGGSVDYLVDGMTAAERYTNELQRLPQPINSIQELKVSTTNATAEYSRPGTVEVATKSGTNEFHGELYELHQNSALRARDFHSQSVNFLIRNEFGGNLGGPVWIPKIYKGKNKTFFFADVEGIVEHSNASQRYVVPLANWKAGDFSNYTDDAGNLIRIYDPLTTRKDPATGAFVRDPFPNNKLPAERINAAAKKIVSYVPDPNVNIPYYLGQNWQRPAASVVDHKALYTFKGDQILGPHHFSIRYTHTDEDNVAPRYFLNDNQRLLGGNNLSLAFTASLKPNLVNEARAGLQRFHAYRGPLLLDPPITQTLGLPTYPGTVAWPGVYFGDNWTSNGYFEGIDRDNPQDAPVFTTNWADNLTWIRGGHELKFGFFFQTNAVNTFETGQPGGDYNFSGLFTALQDPAAVAQKTTDQQVVNTGAALADLLLGYVDESALNQYPHFYTRQKQISFYAQDNWKVSRSLTLNLGLRYEYWTPFRDQRDQASTLKLNASGGPLVVYPGSAPITKQGFPQNVVDAYTKAGLRFISANEAGLPDSLWNMRKANFAPRLGVAWQLNDKTVIRGAYGIYYWVMPLVQYHQNTRRNPPFSYSFDSLTDPDDNKTAELEFPQGGSAFQNQSQDARMLGKQFISPSALTISKGSGWNILPWDTNFKPQTAQEWNVTVERVLPGKLGLRLSYIGNHGSNLEEFDPINALVPRKQAPGATEAQRRAYPDFATSGTGSMDLLSFNGYSNANQFQTEVRRNFANGFVIQGFYSFLKVLTTSEGGNNTFSGLELLPAALTNNASVSDRLRSIYANDSYIPRQTFSLNASYVLPFGRGKKFVSSDNPVLDRLVGGWQMTGFYYWRSGLYFAPYYSIRGSNTILAPGKTPVIPKDQRQAARWFDPSIARLDQGAAYNGQVFIRRADPLDNDLLNNVPRNFMTGPGFHNVDISFIKNTRVTERINLRLDAQIFNLLNHKNFGLPNTAGVINTGVGLPRLVQFQAKVEF